jgi:putative transposase
MIQGMNPRQSYPTDLSEQVRDMIKHLVPEALPGWPPEAFPRRDILNGVFSSLRSGRSWRMLPHDPPSWRIGYHCCRPWRQDGTWPLMYNFLRGDVRVPVGRRRQSTVGIIDSQLVKIMERGGLWH